MEKLFLVLFLFFLIALCISCVIPQKDGTVSTGAGPGSVIHARKQKLSYTRWVLLNLLIIVLLATISWLVLQEKTAADSPIAANIIAIILYSILCAIFLNALAGTIYVLRRIFTQKKGRTRSTYGKLVLFATGTIFLGRYVFAILSGLLN